MNNARELNRERQLGLPPDNLTAWEQQAAYLIDHLDKTREAVEDLKKHVRDDVSAGVQDGIKALAADPQFGEMFWRQGFNAMTGHARAASTQWIGNRILTALAVAALGVCLGYLLKSGKL